MITIAKLRTIERDLASVRLVTHHLECTINDVVQVEELFVDAEAVIFNLCEVK